MKINVKYDNNSIVSYNKNQALLLIFLIFNSFCVTCANTSYTASRFKNDMRREYSTHVAPSEILRFTETEYDKNVMGESIEDKLKMEISERDPLKYLALKNEVLDLYGSKERRNYRFKQNPGQIQSQSNPVKKDNNLNSSQNSQNTDNNSTPENPNTPTKTSNNNNTLPSEALIKPNEVGRFGNPTEKEFSDEEEIVLIADLKADSNYIKTGKDGEKLIDFSANSILASDKFWCSAGSHDVKDEVNFFIEFSKSYPLSSMWVHWAFAPGEFKIMHSNDKKEWTDLLGGYRLSLKKGDVNWWRSILLNPKTRWNYKSFDERINFDEPFFARYVQIIMRIPVNQYFGIFKMEFYTKTKSLVILKSKSTGEDLCLSVANGKMSNDSPVLGVNCLQAISYGDNRDLWVLNSNGYITTYEKNKCLQSPDSNLINIVNCGLAADFKDDREKWIIDYDGKIRSTKQQFSCLTLVDSSFGDELLPSEMKVSATSTQTSGTNNADNALDYTGGSYWASIPSNQPISFEIYFHKYAIVIKTITIDWKFPAKIFKVTGMLADGFWKDFYYTRKNRETSVNINLNNYDLLGVKITMLESTTKFEDRNIYGITSIHVHTGARALQREPCSKIIGDMNLWEIIYVNQADGVSGQEYKKSWAGLHVTENKFKMMKNFYMKIPDTLTTMNQNAVDIRKKLIKLDSDFSNLDSRLSGNEDILTQEKLNFYSIATNDQTPAYDCAHIIRTFPSKRSGYYWIKNECMSKPLRVYCDFDSYDKKAGLDYFIFNDNQVINSKMEKVKNFKDVRLACTKLGLEPIEIKNYIMLKQIIRLLKFNRYNLEMHSKNYVPIGYDYSCDYSSCSKLFRSFNDIKSGDINDLFNIYNKNMSSNLLSSFLGGSDLEDDDIKNSVGMGDNFKIEYGKLSKKNIIAVVCSTNKDGNKEENKYINLECDSNIRGEAFRNLEIFSKMRFVCPSNCSQSKSAIYGSNIYTDNSSICKAAIHSGVIHDQEGGILELGVQPGRANYKGSSSHNIETIDYIDKWDRSYTVSKYKPYCPIDKIKDYANAMGVNTSSFISMDESSSMIEDLQSNIEDQIKNIVYGKDSDNLEENATNNLNDNSGEKIEKKEIKIKKLQLASELLKFLQINNMSSSKNANSFFKSNANDNESQTARTINNKTAVVSQITTDEALISIAAINNKDVKQIDNYDKIATAFKTLIGKSSNEIENLISEKDIGLTSLNNKFSNFETKIEKIDKLISAIDSRSQINFKQAEHIAGQLKQKTLVGSLRDNYTEDYSTGNILDNYEVFNSKKGIGEVAKWDYYMYNLDGHLRTIHQVGEFIDNRTGSHLILKNRDFYDFELKFSVLLGNSHGSKIFGACFRYVDSFNYYIFEISNDGKGYKRIQKFVRGEKETIDIKYDGGFIVDTWYNIKIRGMQNSFQIYMTTDNSPNMNDHYDLIFTFTDNQLVHGTFAYASYGLKYLMLDNISAVHIACTGINYKTRDNYNILTPDCPRFREDLKNSFTYNWKKIDPIDSTAGPSKWLKIKNIDHRSKVLAQTSLIHGLSPNEEGTIYLLNLQTKICSRGKISVKVKAMDKGIIGIVFRYNIDTINNKTNYYILEVAGGEGESNTNEKFIRLRRKIGDKYSLLSIRQLVGYNKDQWMKIVVLMKDTKFNVYITDENGLDGNLIKIFENDISDNEIKFGMFGLSTYKTRAYFDEITLGTIDEGNYDIEDNRLYVDNELLALPGSNGPENKFSGGVLKKLNSHITNFSWNRCLKYSSPTDKGNFCDSCCERTTDHTNTHHNYLCKKQCEMLDAPVPVNNKTKTWKQCFEPALPEKSVYPYCDNIFHKDYFQTSRCKTDMCNLCCASFDYTSKTKISKINLDRCYTGCITTFDTKPDLKIK